jgi:repressor LexA
MTLGEYIREYRKEHNMSLRDFAELADLSPQYISNIEKGINNDGKPLSPTMTTYNKIAKATGISEGKLLSSVDDFVSVNPSIADSFVSFPVMGEVAAGYDHYAVQDWTEGNIDIPASWLHGRPREDYFVLRVCGQSMFPTYQDGDIVLVLKQATMDHSGQIGVVIYDDDKATLKRVEYVMGEDWMKLSPINPQFPPVMVRDEALEHCRVLGIPKMVIRKVN